jgi:Icc protein
MQTLAHLSDLHLGQSRGRLTSARRLVDQLLIAGIDQVVVTGDLTHQGAVDEYEAFCEIFAPLERTGRLTVVPGNHDRGTDDAGALMMGGERVRVQQRPGLYLVCVDSTAPHNRVSFRSHGEVCLQTLAAIDAALQKAPAGSLVGLLLHHHPVPLPVEGIGEWFANAFGWPHASELKLGNQLLASALGRCDLVLHGHRHVPRHFHAASSDGRQLHVYNAGSSTELQACRVFRHQNGRILSGPSWVQLSPRRERWASMAPVPLPAFSSP